MTKIFKKISPYLGALLIVYLLGNIIFSQNVSPVYYSLSNTSLSKQSLYDQALEFLLSIRSLPEFNEFSPRFEAVYGNVLKEDIIAEDEKNSNYYKNLEYILDKNSKSRDALLKLYVYYIQNNQPDKAIEYLNKAKKVDPNIASF
ncbi:MAG: hypothetical protein ABH812_02070 [bacterium]